MKINLPILIKDEYPEQIKEFLKMFNELAPPSVAQFARDLKLPLPMVRNVVQVSQKSIPAKMATALIKIDPQKRPAGYWLGVEQIEEIKPQAPTDKLKLVNDLLHVEFSSLDELPVFELRRLREDYKINLNWLLDDKNTNDDDMLIKEKRPEDKMTDERVKELINIALRARGLTK